MSVATTIDLAPIARELQLQLSQVEATLALLDDGNTVPFITRYRKDHTGGLDEVQVRGIQDHVVKARLLWERKQTILRSIESQGKLTPQLAADIEAARTAKWLDDLYLPYKPKKQTLATTARERGFEPLAAQILSGEKSGAELDARAAEFITDDKVLGPDGAVVSENSVPTAAEALLGAGHILAEDFSESAELRQRLRKILKRTGKLVSKRGEGESPEDKKRNKPYADYFDYTEELSKVPPHRVLAINRGEWAKALKVKVEADFESMHQAARELLVGSDHPNREFLLGCVGDALDRLVIPSLEREARREMTDKAEEHATHVFARNLRNLLLQPPVSGRRVLAVDPGFKSGCKLAALDEFGKLLEHGIVHVIGREENRAKAKVKMAELIRGHQLTVVAIGNGTACRETEQVVAELIVELASPSAADDVSSTASTASTEPLVESAESVAVSADTTPTEPAPRETVESIVADGTATAQEIDEAVHVADVMTNTAEVIAVDDVAVVLASTDEIAVSDPMSITTCTVEDSEPIAENSATTAESLPPTARPSAPPRPLPKIPPGPPLTVSYVIVNEAGASVYSTSPIGREEFPEFDATLRGAISIGRRLLDPLSELVKIEPANIGVGMYQHDVKAKHLRESLDSVVESCVNYVGVDLNTASPSLLRYVSGLNQLTARRVFEHRTQHGPFRSREELKSVPGIGEGTFIQAAGFLRISGAEDPLDGTWIHPESYEAAGRVLAKLGFAAGDLTSKERLAAIASRETEIHFDDFSRELNIGAHLLRDILAQIRRPGRDPRESLPAPIFKHGILKLEDLAIGMELQGTVLNVVDFGAFVDIGLHDSGLVHVSQIANRFIRDPHEVLAVGDIVKVWVSGIDKERRRVGLTMIVPAAARQVSPRNHEPRDQPQVNRPPSDRPRRGRGRGRSNDRGPTSSDQPTPAESSPPTIASDQSTAAGTVSATAAPPRDYRPPQRGGSPPPRRDDRRRDHQRRDNRRGDQRSDDRPRVYTSSKPKPVIPITKEMEEGREPLRTFGDLMQFYKKKSETDEAPQQE